MSKHLQNNEGGDAVINIKSISKAFSTRLVLRDLSLRIDKGDSVCLCGINGAGKSTLLRIAAGLLHPDSGSVRLCGYDIHKDPEKAKPKLGVISHKSMVYPALTVLENLRFFAELYGVNDCQSRVTELLDDVGLSSYRYDRADILSRGLLQRLSIARALVHRPAILLADEPFTGLDKDACEHLVAVLAGFVDNGGTVIMTTHDINFGLRCCRRMLVLDRSQLILDLPNTDMDTADFANDYLLYARKRSGN
ncbi:MAG: heme ABC exporter ATP-binding protein CcmA [Phycisphaerae bacterium]|nr:heme ABC exporter ATP-binding protein CcmA [Phycisphaerae bacterium]